MTNEDLIKYEALVEQCEAAAFHCFIKLAAKNLTKQYVDYTKHSQLHLKFLTAKVLRSNYKLKLAKEGDDIWDAVEEHSTSCLNLIKVYCQYNDIDLEELQESSNVKLILGDDEVSLTLSSEHLNGRTAMDLVKVSKVTNNDNK